MECPSQPVHYNQDSGPASDRHLQGGSVCGNKKGLPSDSPPLLNQALGYNVEELDGHIALLHEYNEMKDIGQMLLGQMALIRGVTTKELYPEFDLDLND
uniref:DNA repair protein SWI5 homolog n=1 Tax=Varanus komodoensis TaxID=61221 RepID=A0A8D2LSD0_VARKO